MADEQLSKCLPDDEGLPEAKHWSTDYFGTVTIPTAGPGTYNKDALECLLALCRVLGLRYEIKPNPGPGYAKYFVKIAWSDYSTDFFGPPTYATQRRGSFSCGCQDPVEGLRSAISHFVMNLENNAKKFRDGFLQWYKKETGHDWFLVDIGPQSE